MHKYYHETICEVSLKYYDLGYSQILLLKICVYFTNSKKNYEKSKPLPAPLPTKEISAYPKVNQKQNLFSSNFSYGPCEFFLMLVKP